MKSGTVLLTALALCACGGPGSFNGTVANTPLQVRDAVFTVSKDSTGNPVYAQLILSDLPDACAALKAHRASSGATSLTLDLYRFLNGTFAAPDTGDYRVSASLPKLTNGNWGSGQFVRNDPHCTNLLSSHSAMTKEGRVTVQAYRPGDDGLLAGTWEITFGDQADQANGGFTARYCDWSPGDLHCE